jgi:hypothetical protein
LTGERITRLDPEELAYPSGALRNSRRKARVLCPDERVRTAIVGIPDTAFTIPARLKAFHRTWHGYIAVDEDGEYRFFDQELEEFTHIHYGQVSPTIMGNLPLAPGEEDQR